MKNFLKEHMVLFLFVILLSLLFILWARIMVHELSATSHTQNLSTTAARVRCLAHFGWEVDPVGETKRTATIPDPLDAVYTEYNKLQLVCGFDLKEHCGKTVICYTYPVLNFPYQTDEAVFVNILVDNGRLIAGDCMSRSLDGFMLPLDRSLIP